MVGKQITRKHQVFAREGPWRAERTYVLNSMDGPATRQRRIVSTTPCAIPSSSQAPHHYTIFALLTEVVFATNLAVGVNGETSLQGILVKNLLTGG